MLMVAHFICSFCTLVQSLIAMYQHPFYLWKHVPVNWVNKIWSWLCSCTSKLIFKARDLLPWYTLVEPQAECTDLFLLKMKGLGKTCSHPYTIVFLPVSNVCHLISPFVNSNPNPACFTQWDTPGDYNIKSAVIRTTTQSSLQKQRQIYSLNSVCKFAKKREFQISRSKCMWMRLCILPSLWYAKYWTLSHIVQCLGTKIQFWEECNALYVKKSLLSSVIWWIGAVMISVMKCCVSPTETLPPTFIFWLGNFKNLEW